MWYPLAEILRRRKRKAKMDTQQFEFKQVHKIARANGPLKADALEYSHIPRDARTIYLKENELEIRFVCDHSNIVSPLWVYVARKDGDIIEAAAGFLRSGTRTTKPRGYYVDCIFLVDHWLSPVGVLNQVDGIARIKIQTHGYHRLFVRLAGHGTWFVDMAGMT